MDLFIPNERFHEIKRNFGAPQKGDILISSVGNRSGIPYLVKDDDGDFYFKDGNVIWFKDFNNKLNSKYLSYWLKSSLGQNALDSIMIGSAQKALTIIGISGLSITLPHISVQEQTANILSSLDNKIEVNRRMNATLEAMARAVFRQWFVENEEVVEWNFGDVYQIADVIYGAPFASSLFNNNGDGLPLIRTRDLSDHNPEIFTAENHPKKTVIKAGDVIVGMDGEFRVHHWKGPDAVLNQRMCYFKPKNGIPRMFVAEIIREHLEFFERAKVGTTVIHLGKSDIDTFKVILPTKEILKKFGEIAEPILDKIIANEKESRTLARLRDSLLPKLMRGEVRVKA